MRKSLFLIISGLLILLLAAGCSKQVFSGSRTGNDEQFILDFTMMNKTETQEIKLKEGDDITVNIDNKSGRLDIFIKGTDGQELYRGNNASSGIFFIAVPKDDTYMFSVTGSNAKGSVSFKVNH